jgi:hypothetical protein
MELNPSASLRAGSQAILKSQARKKSKVIWLGTYSIESSQSSIHSHNYKPYSLPFIFMPLKSIKVKKTPDTPATSNRSFPCSFRHAENARTPRPNPGPDFVAIQPNYAKNSSISRA